MIGKLRRQVKNVHESKPSELTLNDGTVVKSIRAVEDPKGEVVWTRIVKV